MNPPISGTLAAVRSLQHETVGDQRPFSVNRRKMLWETIVKTQIPDKRITPDPETPEFGINLHEISSRLALSISKTDRIQTGFLRRKTVACRITMRNATEIPQIAYTQTNNHLTDRLTLATAIVLACRGPDEKETFLPGGIQRPEAISPLPWCQTLTMASYLLIPMRPLTDLISSATPFTEMAEKFGVSEYTLKLRLTPGQPPKF